jgi:hypothetical protein
VGKRWANVGLKGYLMGFKLVLGGIYGVLVGFLMVYLI